MGQPASVQPVVAGDTTTQTNQSVTISLLSITVIATTSLFMKWVAVPTELTVSLATASGALVPTLVLRRREHKKSRTARMVELVTGSYQRPVVHVLILAAGLLALVEWASLAFIMFASAFIGYGQLSEAVDQGWLLQDQADSLVLAESTTGVVVMLQWTVMMCGAVLVGRFVARRITRHAMAWAFAAIVVCQVASFTIEVLLMATTGPPVNYLAYVVYPLVSALTIWIGVIWGRRTRGLFLATRLFRRLPEMDRNAVLCMMEEAHVPQRIGRGGHETQEACG